MAINLLKSPIPQWWGKRKSNPESVSVTISQPKVFSTGRPNHNTRFQWHPLITFSVSLLTEWQTKTTYHLGGVKNVHSGLTYLKHYWTFVAGGRLNTVYDWRSEKILQCNEKARVQEATKADSEAQSKYPFVMPWLLCVFVSIYVFLFYHRPAKTRYVMAVVIRPSSVSHVHVSKTEQDRPIVSYFRTLLGCCYCWICCCI